MSLRASGSRSVQAVAAALCLLLAALPVLSTAATLARRGDPLETVTAQRRNPSGPAFAGSVGLAEATRCREITSFCLDSRDNVLLCDGPGKAIHRVSQSDKLLAKWNVDFAPEAIDLLPDGTVLVAGAGVVALLDTNGKVVRRGALPAKRTVTAVTHLADDTFVCTDAPSGYAVYRLDHELKNAKRIINGLSGCCGQMDVKGHGGALYVAENGRFSVDKYDRDGKRLARMTKSNPRAADYYGEGCCEPKNITFGPDGNLYASSSGKMMVKRYTPAGKFLGDVTRVSNPGGCVRVTIALTKDGHKLYMLDTDNNVVRSLKPAPARP